LKASLLMKKLVLVTSLFVLVAGCGRPCTAQNCLGCCTAEGICAPGNLPSACGSGGEMCNACTSTQTCSTANVCEGPVETAGAGGFGGPTNAGGSSGQGGAGGQSTAAVLRVFVTSNRYPGNIGGVTQGDAICTLAAEAGNKGGTWKAFLASSTEDAVSRMADVGPWYQERLIGFAPVKTFNNRANLTTTALAALRYDEQGRDLVSPLFWTGNRTSLNCMSWSSTSGYARTGNDDSLDLTDWSCTGRASLLCVEQ
jgi:hypothetical protein